MNLRIIPALALFLLSSGQVSAAQSGVNYRTDKFAFRQDLTLCAMKNKIASLSDPISKAKYEEANSCRDELKANVASTKDAIRSDLTDPAKLAALKTWFVETTLAIDSLTDDQIDPLDYSEEVWKKFDELILNLEW